MRRMRARRDARVRLALRGDAGFANMVFAIFLMVAMIVMFNAVTLYSQVQSERSQVEQALQLALQSAVTGGASISPNGQTISWNTSAAMAKAALALTVTLPIEVTSSSQSGSTYTADFTPLPQYAPPDWTGQITMADFQTSTQAGNVTLLGQTQYEPESFVAADLTVPITEHFMLIPMQFQIQVAHVAYVNGYNGAQFTVPNQ